MYLAISLSKMLKRLCFVSVTSLALVGCGGETAESTPESTPTPTPTPTANLPTIDAVMIGVSPPFSFKDKNGQLVGIDTEILQAIGELEGFKVNIYEEDWSNVLQMVDSGKYQLAFGGVNYTPEREQKYALTNSYYYNPAALMYKKDAIAQPKTLAELTNLKVGVVAGTKQDREITALENVNISRYETFFKAYNALHNNEIQVAVYDMPSMQYTIKQDPQIANTYHIVDYEGKDNKNTNTVMLLKKSDQALADKLNRGLKTLQDNGQLNAIAKKYTE